MENSSECLCLWKCSIVCGRVFGVHGNVLCVQAVRKGRWVEEVYVLVEEGYGKPPAGSYIAGCGGVGFSKLA